MGDSRRPLNIGEDEWASFMNDVHQSLATFQVPGPGQRAVVDIVESTQEAIVVTPPLQSGPPSR